MTTVEILGTVAGVFRKCQVCNQTLPLPFYDKTGKTCVGCRIRITRNAAEYNRTIGAADWGERES